MWILVILALLGGSALAQEPEKADDKRLAAIEAQLGALAAKVNAKPAPSVEEQHASLEQALRTAKKTARDGVFAKACKAAGGKHRVIVDLANPKPQERCSL